jgi:transcriptional regulator with XRE-family HTH domain
MQAVFEHFMTFLNRIEQIRLKIGMTWSEVAGALGVSRTQLHLIRKGEYEPSQRVLLRLEQAEVNAGLRKPPGDKQGILRLLESIPISRQSIGESEHDAGVVEVPVEYRRGSVPKNLPEKVPVKAPDASVAAKLLVDLLVEENTEAYLQHCLPPQFASKEFLNRLEPASFLRLLDAALEMSLGADWRSRFRGLGQQVGASPGSGANLSPIVARILGTPAGTAGSAPAKSNPGQDPPDGGQHARKT